jgi:hypothetical protein
MSVQCRFGSTHSNTHKDHLPTMCEFNSFADGMPLRRSGRNSSGNSYTFYDNGGYN